MALLDARRLKIAANEPIGTASGDLSIAVDSSLQKSGSQLGLSSTGKQQVLESKVVLANVRSALRNSPGASSDAYDPGSGTYAAHDNSTEAILALLKGSTADDQFNTTTGKIGANVNLDSGYYKCDVRDANDEPIYDGSQNRVWALIACEARTGAGDVDVYFFSGPFSSGATAYTMGVQYQLVYRQRYDLYAMPEQKFSGPFDSADAASLAPDAVKGTHIDFADVLAASGGLEEQASDTLGIKKPANAGLTIDANGIAVNPDTVSLELDGSNALRIKDAGVATAKLANDAASADKVNINWDSAAGTFDGSQTTVTLGTAIVSSKWAKAAKVLLGGQDGTYSGSPSTYEQYNISGTTVTFGAAPPNGMTYDIHWPKANS